MVRKLAIGLGLLTLVASAQAAPQLPAQSTGNTPLLQQAQYWDVGRCRAWRRECAERWGWRSDRWHRCLARHGCDRHRYGDRWD